MFTRDERKRLVQLLGMLGSDHDGEVVNAARLAHRLLRSKPYTWDEVVSVNGSASTNAGGTNRAAGGREAEILELKKQIAVAYKNGFQDGVKSTGQRMVKANWKQFARLVVENEQDFLSDWEIKFFGSFAEGRRNVPTDKQKAIFVAVAERLGLEPPE